MIQQFHAVEYRDVYLSLKFSFPVPKLETLVFTSPDINLRVHIKTSIYQKVSGQYQHRWSWTVSLHEWGRAFVSMFVNCLGVSNPVKTFTDSWKEGPSTPLCIYKMLITAGLFASPPILCLAHSLKVNHVSSEPVLEPLTAMAVIYIRTGWL